VAEFVSGAELFRCQNGRPLLVRYSSANPDNSRAIVSFEGKSFEMYSVRAASGARSATEQDVRTVARCTK
jgi:membrane-bound inhibitor of C-type lysozyme